MVSLGVGLQSSCRYAPISWLFLKRCVAGAVLLLVGVLVIVRDATQSIAIGEPWLPVVPLEHVIRHKVYAGANFEHVLPAVGVRQVVAETDSLLGEVLDAEIAPDEVV